MDWFKVARSRLAVEAEERDLPHPLPRNAREWFYTPGGRLVTIVDNHANALTVQVADQQASGQLTIRGREGTNPTYKLEGWGEFEPARVPDVGRVVSATRAELEVERRRYTTSYRRTDWSLSDSPDPGSSILVLLYRRLDMSRDHYLVVRWARGTLELTEAFPGAVRYVLTDQGLFRLSLRRDGLRIYTGKRTRLCVLPGGEYIEAIERCQCGLVITYRDRQERYVAGVFPTGDGQGDPRVVIRRFPIPRSRLTDTLVQEHYLIIHEVPPGGSRDPDEWVVEIIDLTTDQLVHRLSVPRATVILTYDDAHRHLLALDDRGLVAIGERRTILLYPLQTHLYRITDDLHGDYNLTDYQWCPWSRSLIIRYLMPARTFRLQIKYR